MPLSSLFLVAALFASAPAGALMFVHTLGTVEWRLVGRFQPGLARKDLAARAGEWFVTFDKNDDGVIDWRDDTIVLELDMASRRAMAIAYFLSLDLDGDKVVTEREARTIAVSQRPTRAGQTYDPDMLFRSAVATYDLDKNGRVSLDEMLAALPAHTPSIRGPKSEAPLTPDDPALQRAGYDALVEALFTSADTDADGVLSGEEANAFRTRHGAAPALVRTPGKPPIPATTPAPPGP